MIEGKDQFEVIEAMGVRTVDEILAKTIELEQTQNYLLDLIDTKTKNKAQIRQALTSIMSFIGVLRYSLGEVKR
jgi:hypothetical protein